MELSDYEETCTSEMAYDASQNYSAPCEKEEMELSDYGETCTSEMAYDASQNYSARCEKEELALILRENNPRAVMKAFLRLLMGNYPSAVKEEFCRLLMDSLGCMSVMNYRPPCEKEEMELSDYEKPIHLDTLGNCSPLVYMALNKNKMLLEKYKEKIEKEEKEERERIKFMIYMLLLAIFLGKNDKCKFLATPDRLMTSCITVYLLGNDGAHSYNGNGTRLTTRRRYTRLINEELLDEIRPANLPLHVLQRQPTNKEIGRLTEKIGYKYRLLGLELGLKPAQLDYLIMDYPYTAYRIERMLFMWRDDIEDNATYEILVNAMVMHGINPDIVSQSLERA